VTNSILRPALLCLALFASACGTPKGTPISVTEGIPISIDRTLWIEGDEESCLVSLSRNGPWTQDLLHLVDLQKDRQFVVRANKTVPWRCVAETIYLLQDNGAAYIGMLDAST